MVTMTTQQRERLHATYSKLRREHFAAHTLAFSDHAAVVLLAMFLSLYFLGFLPMLLAFLATTGFLSVVKSICKHRSVPAFEQQWGAWAHWLVVAEESLQPKPIESLYDGLAPAAVLAIHAAVEEHEDDTIEELAVRKSTKKKARRKT